MKRISKLIIAVGFCGISCACNNGAAGKEKADAPSKFVEKKDSEWVVVRFVKDGPLFTLKAGYQTFQNTILRDSIKPNDTIAKVKSVEDTIWIVNTFDTARTTQGQPVFAKDGKPVIKTTQQRVDKRYVQVITVPH